MSYRKYIRICEGNKALARSTDAWLKNRDAFTRKEWKQTLRPLAKQVEADIISKIKSYDPDKEFQIDRLKIVLRDIQKIIKEYDARFTTSLMASIKRMSDYSIAQFTKSLKAIGIEASTTSPAITKEIVQALAPLEAVYVNNYTDDMSKIIRGEIVRGMSDPNLNTFDVARSIQLKFESSMMSIARAEGIAETEINGASETAKRFRAEEVREDNPTLKKAWLNSHKPDARKKHIEVETKTTKKPIDLDEDFVVNGHKASFPRDVRLPAGERKYCGCTAVYLTDETADAGLDAKDLITQQAEK